jgi:hypothetical protein
MNPRNREKRITEELAQIYLNEIVPGCYWKSRKIWTLKGWRPWMARRYALKVDEALADLLMEIEKHPK